MKTATPLSEKIYIPEDVTVFDGLSWMLFRDDAIRADGYEAVRCWPETLRYDDKVYQRVGYNSDSGSLTYKEVTRWATKP